MRANLLFCLLTATILIGCRGSTTYIHRIDNQSRDTLFVNTFHSWRGGDTATTYVRPEETKLILYWEDEGNIQEDFQCLTFIDSIQITASDSLELNKNIMNDSLWDHSQSGNRNIIHECVFVVDSLDLE